MHGHPVAVAIDAGSGSCRALVFDVAGGLMGSCQEEWTYRIAEAPGGLDFDAPDGWRRIARCVRGALGQAGVPGSRVAAVSATSMREGFVLYDRAGQVIFGVPNVDARASAEAEELINEGLADPIYRRGGDWTSITAPARLRWVQRHEPEIWERAAHMTMLGDWVLHRLCGEYVTDPSLGSSSGIFSLAARDWSSETASDIGAEHLLPPVAEPGTVVGVVSAQAAEDTGLPVGLPVVAGGADTQLALLSAGLVDGTRYGIVGGTYWLTAAVLDEPLVDPEVRLRTLCHAVPGRWMMEGVGFLHGYSTRWVRDGLLATARGMEAAPAAYDELDRLAAEHPPGADGVFYLCSNVMNAKSWELGPPAIVGLNPLTIDSTGLGAVFRAVLEEAAYVARGHLEILAEVCREPVHEVDFVGGPSRSAVWPQIVADVTGAVVRVHPIPESTCLGAALCAQVGAGSFADLREATSSVAQTVIEYEPEPSAHLAYDELYGRWNGLRELLLQGSAQGHAPGLWRGAGVGQLAPAAG